tara:strand:- start:12507 stop:12695 length:189 start_codon:yes stop_codon:yes gene_type:complete
MFTIELHDEVIKFLETTGTVMFCKNGVKSFVVNNTVYTETDVPNIFTTRFLEIIIDENYGEK